ncbi:hypothetical protein BKA59DRAFT_76231 [Fusarium tricinctum]|uniref:DNA2/NAM7 helicase-like C-terminal domain-containing protein n=1 Tax=Fusarium tricinctum TaxID=61284 RepID=A0A8K0S587_9HYPO|nr:hypothetical protein BKA59DRAFT_76231 [Fusarium tricinctum]
MSAAIAKVDIACGTPVALLEFANHHQDWAPDLIVVDEAARDTEASSLMLHSKWQESLGLYIGDTKQFQPMALAKGQKDFKSLFSSQRQISLFRRMESTGRLTAVLKRNHRAGYNTAEWALETFYGPIAHLSPKAWVVVGDIAQIPPHLTMEHDLGPGKTTSNPFALQKQTSLLHRVVEGGARHSTLRMNMLAHRNAGCPVNNLYNNNIMLWRHKWNEAGALDAIIKHFQANVNSDHPMDQCFAQVEFTHARATTPLSSSKVNSTHAKWIMQQVESLLESKLMGVGKNAQKPNTVLVVAAYKEQVVDLKMRFMDLA